MHEADNNCLFMGANITSPKDKLALLNSRQVVFVYLHAICRLKNR